LGKDNCGACDVCLGEIDSMEDSLVTSQKILSCVVRLKEYFGADYTAAVLLGSKEQRILANRHDALSTYGLLTEYSKHIVRAWIEQLLGQGFLEKVGEYNVLARTERGWRVLKGEETPLLLKPVKKEKKKKVSKIEKDSWEGVDERLFEILKAMRRVIAGRKNIPAYIVFGDASLRDMARLRPSTPEGFLKVNGVGDQKKEEYAEIFTGAIKEYCLENNVAMDQTKN
jgi:ATP-dependent DNA helicase RecQ